MFLSDADAFIEKYGEKEEEVPEEPQEPDMSVEHKGNFLQGGSFEYEAGDAIYNANFASLSNFTIVTDPKNKYKVHHE